MNISTEFLLAYGAGFCGGVMISIFIVRFKISPIILGMQYYLTRVRYVKHSIYKSFPSLSYNKIENLSREICAAALDQIVSEFDGFWSTRLSELAYEHQIPIEFIAEQLERECETLLARIGKRSRKNMSKLKSLINTVKKQGGNGE